MALIYSEAFAAIGANDFPTTVQFYRALLGREPDEWIPAAYAAFQLAGLQLGIFAPRPAHRPEFTHPPGSHGSLSLVLRVPDLDRAHREVAALNPHQALDAIQTTSQRREFNTYDPEGNRLILVEEAAC